MKPEASPVTSFRHRFLPPFLFSLSPMLLVVAWLAFDRRVSGRPVLILQIMALTIGALAVFTAGWTKLLKVTVRPDGIRCYDVSCRYWFVKWAEILWVRPVNLLGLRYLRVGFGDGRHPLWVPMFLSDMPGFRRSVSSHAGSENVLAKSLETPGA